MNQVVSSLDREKSLPTDSLCSFCTLSIANLILYSSSSWIDHFSQFWLYPEPLYIQSSIRSYDERHSSQDTITQKPCADKRFQGSEVGETVGPNIDESSVLFAVGIHMLRK